MDSAAQTTTADFEALPFAFGRRKTRSRTENPLILGLVPGPRYVLHPGYVRHEGGGFEEYCSAQRLARLYGITLRGCVIAGDRYQPLPGDIHFHPRADGRYEGALGKPGIWLEGIAVSLPPPG